MAHFSNFVINIVILKIFKHRKKDYSFIYLVIYFIYLFVYKII